MPNKQTKLINTMQQTYPEQRIMHWSGNKHLTGRALLNMGIKCCTMCGYLMPLEAQLCRQCGEEAIVVAADLVNEKDINLLVCEVKPNTSTRYKRCKKCKHWKPTTAYTPIGIMRYRVNCDECIKKIDR